MKEHFFKYKQNLRHHITQKEIIQSIPMNRMDVIS